jgi:hypothetical protein
VGSSSTNKVTGRNAMDGMIDRGIMGIATALLLLSGPAIASADSTWSAMVKIGMNGTWASSCSTPISAANSRQIYYRGSDGRVWRKYDRGPNDNSLNVTIDSAQVITPTTIRARMRNDDPNWGSQNGTVTDVVIEIANNRMRSLNSITPDGTQLIKDGVFVKGGTAVPSFEKCSN